MTAALSGASPQTIAATVAAPLERQLGRIAGVTDVRSYSIYGRTSITLEFELGRDIDRVANDVQAAINAASTELPKNLSEPPSLVKNDGSIVPLLQLALTSETLRPEAVFDWAETVVAQKLAAVEGVAVIGIGAADKPTVRVRVDPASLSSLGLGWDDLSAAVAGSTASVPKGSLDGARRTAIIVDADTPHDAAGYRSLVIADRDGAPVRLSDIAKVTDDKLQPHAGAWLNGSPAVFISVKRQAGANLVETTERIRSVLQRLGEWLPAGIKVSVLSDRSTATRAAIADARLRWLAAVGLVAATLALFLGWRWAGALPVIMILVAIAGSLIVLALLRYSLDLISLTALTMAVGFVAHDAFLMVDSIARQRSSGGSALDAALAGASVVSRPIFATTVAFCGALLPLMLAPGITGSITEEIAIALGASVASSTFLSLTIVPAVCAHLAATGRDFHLTRTDPPPLPARLLRWYSGSLRWALRHRAAVLALIVLAYGTTAVIYRYMPTGFVPPQDSGIIWGWTAGEVGASSVERSRNLRDTAQIIMADPAVAEVGYGIGEWDDWLSVNLRPAKQRNATVQEIIARLEPKLARLPRTKTYLQPLQDFWLGGEQGYAQYQYALLDENVDELVHWLAVVREKLRQLPELEDVGSHLQHEGIEARLMIDRDRAAHLGISAQDISDTLYNAFGLRQVGRIYGALDQVPVVLEADVDQSNPDLLRDFSIKSAAGAQVSLGNIASTGLAIAPMAIARQGQLPYATLAFNLSKGTSLSQAIARIRATEAELRLPPTVSGRFDSNAKEFVASSRLRPLLILAAVVIVYIVLGVVFESYVQPLTVLATLPLSGLGAGLALLTCSLDFSLLAFVGVILLIGVCLKSAIMIVDVALREERENGLPAFEAVLAACLRCFRSILASTAMAVLCALPLVFASGAGSELQRPLGIAVAGGVLVAQLAVLYVTPVIYVQLARARRRITFTQLAARP